MPRINEPFSFSIACRVSFIRMVRRLESNKTDDKSDWNFDVFLEALGLTLEHIPAAPSKSIKSKGVQLTQTPLEWVGHWISPNYDHFRSPWNSPVFWKNLRQILTVSQLKKKKLRVTISLDFSSLSKLGQPFTSPDCPCSHVAYRSCPWSQLPKPIAYSISHLVSIHLSICHLLVFSTRLPRFSHLP